MLNHDRIRSRLDDISTCLTRLRHLLPKGREAFLEDEDSRDIARSRLLTAIEASLNICYHVAAKKLQRVPDDYAQCFLILADNNLIERDLAGRLATMARFRNRLVHLYWDIDYGRVYDVIADDLDDLEAFAGQVATWI